MKMKDNKRTGFTIVELMMAVSISAFVLTSVYASLINLAKGSEGMINYSEMNNQSRLALEMLGRDTRMAREVEMATETQVMLEREIQGTVYDVLYTYLPQTGTFSRTIFVDDDKVNPDEKTVASIQGARTVYLYDVEKINLKYYNFRQSETRNPREIKHVQIDGLMERSVLNLRNTNYVISARFMMRNKDVTN